ncbi:MAG TPA: efflux RND transporter periplasmic adaptor subunit [Bacteroidia bacterium]|nr:efflux RND transporter periplasmic adaptor subunit [Bacteroidia bacterium]HNS11125.1 efflux RND transporter periplasmic adaptor subunit [Bacteroidia bacterium]
MKPGKILFFLAIVFIAVVLYINKCNTPENKTATGNRSGNKPAMLVNGFVSRASAITDNINVTGSLLSNQEILIRNEIAGKLDKIYFNEGAFVREGELLAKINDDDLRARLTKLRLEEDLNELVEGRQKDLLIVDGVSKEEYDRALNALQLVKAEISLLQVQISKTEIRAPFSGVLGLQQVNEGAYLPQYSAIVSLQDISPIKLEFSVPEKYLSMISVSQEVSFTLQSSNTTFTAGIYAKEPKVDPETRSLIMRAKAANPDGKLSPGSFASVNVPLRTIPDALMIPSQAIIPELKGYKLFVLRNGLAKPGKVEIGIRNDSTVQITSGIQPGDTVLIDGIMQLRPDMPVKVTIN